MAELPSYLTAAKPIPAVERAPWYKTIVPAYLGVMLWFVFWQDLITGGLSPTPCYGMLARGPIPFLLGVIIAIMTCQFFFYLPSALMGHYTGLPLYVIGTAAYGARGGLFMPGFLMGILQFGWLAVNAFFVAGILCTCFGLPATAPGWAHGIIATLFIFVAALVGLKGIRYVGKVGTYLPIIPALLLIILTVITFPGIKKFRLELFAPPPPPLEETFFWDGVSEEEMEPPPPEQRWQGPPPLTSWQIIGAMCIYIVGFFATAGAAGADFAMNTKRPIDVHWGGIVGIIYPTFFIALMVLFILNGAYGLRWIQIQNIGILNPVKLLPDMLDSKLANWAMIGLAISSFPGACFSSFIAANSFKTTMPKVNPFISVGIGALVAALLAVSGVVGKVIWVFQVIGASFGPVCGALFADYLLSGFKWGGPRAGFNPAGWISWIVGFVVGAFNLVVDLLMKWPWASEQIPNLSAYADYIPVPPISAFVVGFALYIFLSVIGARTKRLPFPGVTA